MPKNYLCPRKSLLTLLLSTLVVAQNVTAQNSKPATADDNYKTSVEFESSNVDSSEVYASKAYRQLKSTNDTLNPLFSDVLNQYGRINFYKKDLQKSYAYFKRVFDLQVLTGNESNAYKVKVNMALVQKQLGNVTQALDDFFDIAAFYETNDPESFNLGITYNNIADLYTENKQPSLAAEFYNKATPFFAEYLNNLLQIRASQIANYNSFDTKKSLEVASQLVKEQNLDSVPGFIQGPLFNNISRAYYLNEMYDEALPFAHRSLDAKKTGGFDNGIAIQYNNLGNIYYELKEFKTSLAYLDTAYQQMTSNRQKLDILKNLQKVHKATQNYEQSLRYADEYIHLKDSLNEVLTQKEIVELGINYEVEEKNQFIERLRNLSLVYKILIGFIVLLSVVWIIWLVRRNKSISLEMDALQSELDEFKHNKELQNLGAQKQLMTLKSNVVIPMEDILYVKSDGHYVEYYLEDRERPEVDRNSLSRAMESLPNDSFMRIHKSYIVNIYKIKIINSTEVMLDNGTWINLSRTYKNELRQLLNKPGS